MFALAFLLMLVTFRSIVIPIKAIVLNLLSIGAAYGVLVLVFQEGYGEDLLGFTSNGGVTSWLPLFLFVILFGLSMDYHVFILSRVREAYDGGMSTPEAVRHGISTTAGTVTSAALVMVFVFSVFITLTFLDFKEMGVGLAVAVLIDATIVRGVLLPASMKVLGDWNWYLPKWLEWLPHAQRSRSRRIRSRRPGRLAGPLRQRDDGSGVAHTFPMASFEPGTSVRRVIVARGRTIPATAADLARPVFLARRGASAAVRAVSPGSGRMNTLSSRTRPCSSSRMMSVPSRGWPLTRARKPSRWVPPSPKSSK